MNSPLKRIYNKSRLNKREIGLFEREAMELLDEILEFDWTPGDLAMINQSIKTSNPMRFLRNHDIFGVSVRIKT